MIDALPRIDPLSRVLARFAFENGIGSVRRIRAFLALDADTFAAAARRWDWGSRREAPKAMQLSAFLAGFDPGGDRPVVTTTPSFIAPYGWWPRRRRRCR